MRVENFSVKNSGNILGLEKTRSKILGSTTHQRQFKSSLSFKNPVTSL